MANKKHKQQKEIKCSPTQTVNWKYGRKGGRENDGKKRWVQDILQDSRGDSVAGSRRRRRFLREEHHGQHYRREENTQPLQLSLSANPRTVSAGSDAPSFSQGFRWAQHAHLSPCQLFWRTAPISGQNLLREELETIFSNCLFPVRAALPSSYEMKSLRSQIKMLSMSKGSAWPQVPHWT